MAHESTESRRWTLLVRTLPRQHDCPSHIELRHWDGKSILLDRHARRKRSVRLRRALPTGPGPSHCDIAARQPGQANESMSSLVDRDVCTSPVCRLSPLRRIGKTHIRVSPTPIPRCPFPKREAQRKTAKSGRRLMVNGRQCCPTTGAVSSAESHCSDPISGCRGQVLCNFIGLLTHFYV